MSFSDLLQTKLAQRRQHGSPVAAAARLLREQALERVADIRDAVTAMVLRLSDDPVFVAAYGPRPAPTFKWSPDMPRHSSFRVDGALGSFIVRIRDEPAFLDDPARIRLSLMICPEWEVGKELGCGSCYAEATPVEADICDIDAFLAAAEDMLAEYLSDVAISALGSKLLPGVAT